MSRQFRCLIVAAFLAASQFVANGQTNLVTQAHAHNDYEHPRPLFGALDCGFCSVEADIFLTNGQLLVAHKLEETKPDRTLQSLYLDPLRTRVKENGGSVYTNGPEFTLLIDLKQNWKTLYPALRDVLTNYADMLVVFKDGVKQSNAIIVIITGNRDEIMFAGESVRYAAFDGQLSDLDSNPPASLVPWISGNWKDSFHWNGRGAMPDAELQKLQQIVRRAHEQGRRVRFWNSPDNSNFWQAMHVAGVDLINTDNLPGVAKFFGGK
jgi:Glycerophosphoryl diester phosphodiesterase family